MNILGNNVELNFKNESRVLMEMNYNKMNIAMVSKVDEYAETLWGQEQPEYRAYVVMTKYHDNYLVAVVCDELAQDGVELFEAFSQNVRVDKVVDEQQRQRLAYMKFLQLVGQLCEVDVRHKFFENKVFYDHKVFGNGGQVTLAEHLEIQVCAREAIEYFKELEEVV